MYKTNSGATVVGLDHDGKTIAQLEMCLANDRAVAGALCADGHLGFTQPIGGVVAYRNALSPVGVGYDIACGNLAVKLDASYSDIKNRINTLADDIEKNLSFGVGRKNDKKPDHWLFDMRDAWDKADALELREKAQEQLGTIGSGNHYVDIFVEEIDGKVEDSNLVTIFMSLHGCFKSQYFRGCQSVDDLDRRWIITGC